MAAIDFPTSPAVGQYFNAQGKTWVWDGVSWNIEITNFTAVSPAATLNNPNFTGIPTAPTATAGTNTTQIATTAFVGTAIAAIDALPSQSGNGGKYLTTDGTVASWGVIDTSSSVPMSLLFGGM